ncbi:hypothetical protein INR49_031446 [Caranx melampygus]|nr:hypothetical protein INR49_031446 [Caranx melampygus]
MPVVAGQEEPVRQVSSLRWIHKDKPELHHTTPTMFQLLLLLAAVLLAGYIVLTQTLFKRSRCRGNAAVAGKTVVITGGNTGIGKATALHLASRGARVILACRNRDKAEDAIAQIQQETGSTDVVYMHLDLASLKSFGVNHLGHFLLTCLLLDRLKEAGGGRVVTVSSMAHRWGSIDFEVSPDIRAATSLQHREDGGEGGVPVFMGLAVNRHLGTGRYSWQFFQAYCNSKLCNVLFTHELAKRLKGTSVTCYSLHPGNPHTGAWGDLKIQYRVKGVVRTELSRNVSLWQRIFIEPVAWLLFLDPEAGAQTTLHCAMQEGIEPLSGRYFSCCTAQELCVQARDDALARKLWEVSERLCGLS